MFFSSATQEDLLVKEQAPTSGCVEASHPSAGGVLSRVRFQAPIRSFEARGHKHQPKTRSSSLLSSRPANKDAKTSTQCKRGVAPTSQGSQPAFALGILDSIGTTEVRNSLTDWLPSCGPLAVKRMGWLTGIEPATTGVTILCSTN